MAIWLYYKEDISFYTYECTIWKHRLRRKPHHISILLRSGFRGNIILLDEFLLNLFDFVLSIKMYLNIPHVLFLLILLKYTSEL